MKITMRIVIMLITTVVTVALTACLPGHAAENLWTACGRSEKQNQDKGSEKPQPYGSTLSQAFSA